MVSKGVSTVTIRRILLVEPSDSMRQVAAEHLATGRYELLTASSYADAHALLNQRFDNAAAWIDAVVLGWPIVAEAHAMDCLAALEQGEHRDLPLVILSADQRADTRAWVDARPHSTLLGWKHYQESSSELASLLRTPADAVLAKRIDRGALSILVVMKNSSNQPELPELLRERGHAVQCVELAAVALNLARSGTLDLILIDTAWSNHRGDALCRQIVDDRATQPPIVMLWLDHPAGHQIERCLRAGATLCLNRNESNRLQVARIEALGRLAPPRSTSIQALPTASASEVLDLMRPLGWEREALPLLQALRQRRSAGSEHAGHYLLILLELDLQETGDMPNRRERLDTVTQAAEHALQNMPGAPLLPTRVEHHRLAMLVDETDGKRGYLQVREIMQACNASAPDDWPPGSVCCTACVLAPAGVPELALDRLLLRLRRGLHLVASRQINQALLLDVKKLLPVYPGVSAVPAAADAANTAKKAPSGG